MSSVLFSVMKLCTHTQLKSSIRCHSILDVQFEIPAFIVRVFLGELELSIKLCTIVRLEWDSCGLARVQCLWKIAFVAHGPDTKVSTKHIPHSSILNVKEELILFQMVWRRKRFDDFFLLKFTFTWLYMRTKLQLVQRLKLFITNLFAVLHAYTLKCVVCYIEIKTWRRAQREINKKIYRWIKSDYRCFP